jgi:hypothetical protein
MRKFIFLTVLLTVLGITSRTYAENASGQAAGKRQHKPMKSTHKTVVAGQVDRRSLDKRKGGSADSSDLEKNKVKGSASSGASDSPKSGKGETKGSATSGASSSQKTGKGNSKGSANSGASTGQKSGKGEKGGSASSGSSPGQKEGKGKKGSSSGSGESVGQKEGKGSGKSKAGTDDWQNASNEKTTTDNWNSPDAKAKHNGAPGAGGPPIGSMPIAGH